MWGDTLRYCALRANFFESDFKREIDRANFREPYRMMCVSHRGCGQLMIPFLQRLDAARHVLIAGIGGGFDVYAGIPIATYLWAKGRSVVFANLSFSNLWDCGS